jgi:hypothetical protein
MKTYARNRQGESSAVVKQPGTVNGYSNDL